MEKWYEDMMTAAGKMGWTIEVGMINVKFKNSSPAGLDFCLEFKSESLEEVVGNLKEICNDYDCSREAYKLLNSSGHGISGMPYSMKAVYEDMEKRLEMIKSLMNDLEQLLDLGGRLMKVENQMIPDNRVIDWKETEVHSFGIREGYADFYVIFHHRHSDSYSMWVTRNIPSEVPLSFEGYLNDHIGKSGWFISAGTIENLQKKAALLNNDGFIEYRSDKKEDYKKDLKFWSNCCGELHYHGKRDIQENELPEALAKAYTNLWTDATGSRCYLVEYKGAYGIALINEFDEDYADTIHTSMSRLYGYMKNKAGQLRGMEEFKSADIIIAEDVDNFQLHELVVILPCETEKTVFDRIAAILTNNVYV